MRGDFADEHPWYSSAVLNFSCSSTAPSLLELTTTPSSNINTADHLCGSRHSRRWFRQRYSAHLQAFLKGSDAFLGVDESSREVAISSRGGLLFPEVCGEGSAFSRAMMALRAGVWVCREIEVFEVRSFRGWLRCGRGILPVSLPCSVMVGGWSRGSLRARGNRQAFLRWRGSALHRSCRWPLCGNAR